MGLRKVAMIGAGLTKFHRFAQETPKELAYEAVKMALDSCEMTLNDIDSVCLGTACHVRGGERVRERIEDTLGICDGETTRDRRFTLESVRCIGCCSLGPVVKINDDIHGRISSDEIDNTLEGYE